MEHRMKAIEDKMARVDAMVGDVARIGETVCRIDETVTRIDDAIYRGNGQSSVMAQLGKHGDHIEDCKKRIEAAKKIDEVQETRKQSIRDKVLTGLVEKLVWAAMVAA